MEIPRLLLKDLVHEKVSVEALREQSKTSDLVEYLHEPVTYIEFFNRYLLPNKACVLGPWATEGWRSRKKWVGKNNTPNVEFLSDKFGDATVPVANCEQQEYSAQPKSDMTLKDYTIYLKAYENVSGDASKDCLYLKDWHFTRTFPDYNAYSTPPYFCSDWLNEFWAVRKDQRDDYQFVYIGPKGSWTPFHADVFRSYSWSANICGCKKWWLFPPGEENLLKDNFGQLAYDIRSPDLQNKSKFPHYKPSVKKFEVIQQSGEVIFVPSGWHHQVFNVEDTISINHNWLNGCNIDISWKFIKDSLLDVQHEISDCSDMEGWNQQCQLILKASSGIDYVEFFNFMQTIGQRRIDFLKSSAEMPNHSGIEGKHSCDVPKETDVYQANETCMRSFDRDESEKILDFERPTATQRHYYDTVDVNHALFDLIRVRMVVNNMLKNAEFNQLDWTELTSKPPDFLCVVDNILDEYDLLK